MATGRSSFAKRQRDMAKKAKAAAKRERRLEKGDEDEELEEVEEFDGPRLSNEEIMERVADLHRRYDDGQMDLDTFDELKAELMAQMVIDWSSEERRWGRPRRFSRRGRSRAVRRRRVVRCRVRRGHRTGRVARGRSRRGSPRRRRSPRAVGHRWWC